MSLGARSLVVAAVLLLPLVALGQRPPRYSARLDGEIVRLGDATTQTSVGIKPSAGNVGFELKVKGQDVLFFSGAAAGIEAFKGGLTGIPFMGPWANRLDEQAFYANGRKYPFDMTLGNVRGAIPIHGFLTSSATSPVVWDVVELKADASAAWVTSRLDFTANPMWIKQFPFAHTIDITHRLQNGELEVRTKMTNHSIEPMPVAVGFHPYFQLTEAPRAEWKVSIGAKAHYLLADTKVPTGETEPIGKQFPDPSNISLATVDLDDVYGDLVRDASGKATMTVKGPKSQQLDVVLGPNWKSVVVYSPSGRGFICFEPMAGPTNALNMAQRGLYKELQSIPPKGGVWQESFWVRPSGF